MENFERKPIIISFNEVVKSVEVYGFTGSQGTVFLEGQLFVPADSESKTVILFMHPATTLNLLPMPSALANAGLHVMCCGSRYAKNDSALIMENVLRDLAACIRYAKEQLDYEKIVLVGWSGGGSLSVFYQAEAEDPTITMAPAGDPVDVVGAGLIPADGLMSIASHLSRAETLTEWIDPSVNDELNPDSRTVELDIYNPENPNQPPYDNQYLAFFRAKQVERNRRISLWVKGKLAELQKADTAENERAFVVYRTMADPRWIDSNIDPNDRQPSHCYLGVPETVNSGPVGLARFTTLRSWLSQWSYDDSNARTDRNAGRITVPALVIENSADDATPAKDPRAIYDLLGSKDKEFHVIKGATHYYKGQPELLDESVAICLDWLRNKNLIEM